MADKCFPACFGIKSIFSPHGSQLDYLMLLSLFYLSFKILAHTLRKSFASINHNHKGHVTKLPLSLPQMINY